MCCRKKTYERQKDWESPEIFTWQKRLRTCWKRDSSSSIPTWSLLKRVYRLKRNTKRDTQCSIWIQRDACCRMATHEQRCNSKARRSIEQGFVCSPSPSTAYKKLLKQLNKCVQTVEQRKLDAVCQRKKKRKQTKNETRSSETHDTDSIHNDQKNWITYHELQPLFHGLKIGWQNQDHEWLTTGAHTCARHIDDEYKNSHVAMWLHGCLSWMNTHATFHVYIFAAFRASAILKILKASPMLVLR